MTITKEYFNQYQLLESQYNCIYEEIKTRAIEIGLLLKLISEKDVKEIKSMNIENDIVYIEYEYYCGEWCHDQYQYSFPIEYLWSDNLVELEINRKKELKIKLEKEAVEKKKKDEEVAQAKRYCLYKKLKLGFEGENND
jgi:hypothetical protein